MPTASKTSDPKIAVVTGGNRGIGLEVCRQLASRDFHVLLGARDAAKGEAAAESLRGHSQSGAPNHGKPVTAVKLDVTSDVDAAAAAEMIRKQFGRLDVLVNNAAVLYDSFQNVLNADLRLVREAFDTNTLGPYRLCLAFLPLLRNSKHARIVNVSSEAGSLASMGGGAPAYGISKTALHALTRKLAAQLRSEHILVNAVSPGWVRTEMGGPNAPRSVEQGAAGILWAATLPDDGPTGGFFRDGKAIPW